MKKISEKVIDISILTFGVILSLYYIINIIFKSIEFGFSSVISERFTGGLSSLPWGASNVVSAVLVFPVAVALARYDFCKKKVYILALSVVSIGMLATLSRAAMIILMLYLISWILVKKKITFKFLLMLLFSSAIICSIFYIWAELSSDSFNLMFSDRFDKVNIFSGNSRLDSWVEKLKFFFNNPFYPIGYYGSLTIFEGFTAHNYFITVLLEQSFVGLIVNIIFLALPFCAFFSLKATFLIVHCRWYVLGLLFVSLNLFVEDANFTQQFILLFWAYMGLLYGKVFQTRNEMIRA
jgi:hypothetical protein